MHIFDMPNIKCITQELCVEFVLCAMVYHVRIQIIIIIIIITCDRCSGA